MGSVDTSSETGRNWARATAQLDSGIGAAGSLGIISLATDRIGVWDVERFLEPLPDVEVFSTRVFMDSDVNPQTLRALGGLLESAAQVLVPESKLDVIAFSCTSGTVAIGPEVVREKILKGRPGVAVTTPINAAIEAFRVFDVENVALLTPYHEATADLVADHFCSAGVDVLSCTTFNLRGDIEMNRVSSDSLISAARDCVERTPAASTLFISCTGLRTSSVVDRLERETGKRVITSNQALAWHALRLCGIQTILPKRGELFVRRWTNL